jgi:hypothetical protein
MQGCNPSADPVAGISGRLTASRFFHQQSWQQCEKSQGFGDRVPVLHSDLIPDQLVGHYR